MFKQAISLNILNFTREYIIIMMSPFQLISRRSLCAKIIREPISFLPYTRVLHIILYMYVSVGYRIGSFIRRTKKNNNNAHSFIVEKLVWIILLK